MSLLPHDEVYQQIETRLSGWAAARPDVRAVVVIGSRARSDHPADEWSDLDLIVFTDDRDGYAKDAALRVELESALGLPVLFTALSDTGHGDPELEFVLEGGCKVDLVFTPNRSPKGPAASLADMTEDFPYHSVFERGARALVEKAPSGRPPRVNPYPPYQPPTQAEFDNRIANYLLDLVRAAKLSGRGELWRAARAVNEQLHQSLLVLLEWHARGVHGPGYDTWRYGRFLEEWADPRALAALPATYTANTLPGVRQAVAACLDLLDWLGPQTAAALGLSYPSETVRRTAEWLREQ